MWGAQTPETRTHKRATEGRSPRAVVASPSWQATGKQPRNTDKGFDLNDKIKISKTNDKGFNSSPFPKNKTSNGKQTEMVKDPITGKLQKVMDITTLGHDLKFDVNKNIKFFYDDVTKSFEVVDMDNKIRYQGNLK